MMIINMNLLVSFIVLPFGLVNYYACLKMRYVKVQK